MGKPVKALKDIKSYLSGSIRIRRKMGNCCCKQQKHKTGEQPLQEVQVVTKNATENRPRAGGNKSRSKREQQKSEDQRERNVSRDIDSSKGATESSSSSGLRHLHKQNCNILAHGSSDTTVGPKTIQALQIFGADVNARDKFCVTPFERFMIKLKYYKDPGLVVSILKVFLYRNPNITLNRSSVMQALEYDQALYKRLRTSDNEDSSFHLYLLPWLRKAGFNFNMSIYGIRLLYNVDELLPLYASNGENFESVQSLKNLCRTVIRTIYPGSSLHTAVENAECPDSVKDFILIKELLS